MKCAFIFYCIIFNLLVVKSRTSKSLQKSQSYCNYLKRLLKIGVCPEIFISKKISWTTIKMTVLFTRWSGRSVETEKLWSRIQENETDSTLLMNNWNVMKNKGGFYPLATERNNLRIKSEKNNLLSILLWITSLIPGNKCPHTRKVSNCCVIEKLSRRCHSILLPSSWVVTQEHPRGNLHAEFRTGKCSTVPGTFVFPSAKDLPVERPTSHVLRIRLRAVIIKVNFSTSRCRYLTLLLGTEI